MEGHFSAQVVPNDEMVSAAHGKKIFAFAQHIWELGKQSPKKWAYTQIFDDTFRASYYAKREACLEDFFAVYDVSTIGHEFGHTLWLDTDTEVCMNASGAYKNLEEYKATMGGLVAFFAQEDITVHPLAEHILMDHIWRTVSLLQYRQTQDIEPYYCEALMHLYWLRESGILALDGLRCHVDMATSRLQSWYTLVSENYQALAQHYIAKRDAGVFLSDCMQVTEDGYMPQDPELADFVAGVFACFRDGVGKYEE